MKLFFFFIITFILYPSKDFPYRPPSAPPTPCNTGISETGTRGIYFEKYAPVTDINPTSPKIRVRTAFGQIQRSSDSGRLGITRIPEEASHGHVMPSLPHSSIKIGKFYGTNCTVVFNKTIILVLNLSGDTILTGWSEKLVLGSGVSIYTRSPA